MKAALGSIQRRSNRRRPYAHRFLDPTVSMLREYVDGQARKRRVQVLQRGCEKTALEGSSRIGRQRSVLCQMRARVSFQSTSSASVRFLGRLQGCEPSVKQHVVRNFKDACYEERQQECLSRLILFGEASLWRVLTEYVAHYHGERNHQGKGNLLLFPKSTAKPKRSGRSPCCPHRLGGLLKYYERVA